MTDTPQIALVIRYTNGTEQTYEFPSQQVDPANMISRIHRALDQGYLLLSMEDRVCVIPLQGIQYFQLMTPLSRLPDTALQGVRLVSEK